MTTTGEAERARVLAVLRAQTGEPRRRGDRRLRLTGRVARSEAGPDSDVDLLAEIDRAAVAPFSLLDLAGLELDLAAALGREDQHPYELFLQLEGIAHKITRVGRPQSNGIVERLQRCSTSNCGCRTAPSRP